MIVRGIVVWLVLIGAEIVHGVARGVLLVPVVGDLRSRQIGVFTGSLIIVAIALAFVRWIGAATRRQLIAVGLLWLVLTLAFEVVFGRFVAGYTWQRLLSDYNPAEGGLLGIGMLLLALAPLIAARLRRIV